MNKYILSQLKDAELKALYPLLCKNEIKRGRIKEAVMGAVQDLRLQLKSISGIDKLADKESTYGNSGRWGQSTLSAFESAVFDSKRPDHVDLGQWVSVEIECIMPDKDAEKQLIKYIRANSLTNWVTLKDDGSLSPNGQVECDNCGGDGCDDCSDLNEYGREIIVTCKYGDWNTINLVCDKLQKIGAYVNKTCGLHVHLDCRDKSPRQVSTIAKRIALCVPALKLMLPVSRRHNHFCEVAVNSHRRGSRYAFVNVQSYRKHRTLEIRGHSGTLDADKIINWIKLMRLLGSKPNRIAVETPNMLIAKVAKLDIDLATYVLARVSKFSPESLVEQMPTVQAPAMHPLTDAPYSVFEPTHMRLARLGLSDMAGIS